MTVPQVGDGWGWLGATSQLGAIGGLSDGQLLARFREASGPEGELAFEAIVRRHGPLVLARCQAVLRDDRAADAFQATFLVLARRSATVRDPDRLAPWLGRVARRVALRSRRATLRDRARAEERQDRPAPTSSAPALDAEESALVGAAVDRLPERDRLLIRLTYWQGKTYEEAAALLGWPVGTVRSRLHRVRRRLRDRLGRFEGAFGAAWLGPSGWVRRPIAVVDPNAELVARTVRGAVLLGRAAAGSTTVVAGAGVVPAAVATLVHGELAMMTRAGRWLISFLVVGGVTALGAATLAQRSASVPRAATPAPPPAAAPAQSKPTAPGALVNPGFEEGVGTSPTAWERGREVAGVDLIWSHEVAHGGKSALGFRKSTQRYFPIAEWTQKFTRTGELPRLRVVAWVKTQSATKALVDVQFRADDSQNGGSHAWASHIGPREAGKPPVTHDWQRYEGIVAIPPGTRSIVIAPQIYGPGTVWFDDLSVEYTADPAIDPVNKNEE